MLVRAEVSRRGGCVFPPGASFLGGPSEGGARGNQGKGDAACLCPPHRTVESQGGIRSRGDGMTEQWYLHSFGQVNRECATMKTRSGIKEARARARALLRPGRPAGRVTARGPHRGPPPTGARVARQSAEGPITQRYRPRATKGSKQTPRAPRHAACHHQPSLRAAVSSPRGHAVAASFQEERLAAQRGAGCRSLAAYAARLTHADQHLVRPVAGYRDASCRGCTASPFISKTRSRRRR